LFVRSEYSRAIDFDQLGEQALKDNKEHRDLQQRLGDIEKELNDLTQAADKEVRKYKYFECSF
jgi:hypothetical protein